MGGRLFFTKIITPKQANPRNQPRIDSSVVVVGSWKSDLWGEFCGFKTDSTMKKWPPEKKPYSSIVPQLDPWDGNLYPAIFPLFMWPFFTFHVGKWSIPYIDPMFFVSSLPFQTGNISWTNHPFSGVFLMLILGGKWRWVH